MGGGPPGFARDSTSPVLLWRAHGNGDQSMSHTGLSPSLVSLSRLFRYRRFCNPSVLPQPRPEGRFGLFPLSLAATDGIDVSFFSSRYLDVSVPWVRSTPAMHSPAGDTDRSVPSFLIQRSWDHRLFASFPRLIAGCHVFHRLSMPRHPPYTLSNLATFIDHRRGIVDFRFAICDRNRASESRVDHAFSIGRDGTGRTPYRPHAADNGSITEKVLDDTCPDGSASRGAPRHQAPATHHRQVSRSFLLNLEPRIHLSKSFANRLHRLRATPENSDGMAIRPNADESTAISCRRTHPSFGNHTLLVCPIVSPAEPPATPHAGAGQSVRRVRNRTALRQSPFTSLLSCVVLLGVCPFLSNGRASLHEIFVTSRPPTEISWPPVQSQDRTVPVYTPPAPRRFAAKPPPAANLGIDRKPQSRGTCTVPGPAARPPAEPSDAGAPASRARAAFTASSCEFRRYACLR